MVWEGPVQLWASQEGDRQHCHFWEGVLVLEGNLARFTASSSDDVELSNHLLRAKNLVFLGFSQSLSSELPLVVPLAISDLALACLGECIALGRERVWSWSLPDLAHTFELASCYLLLLLKEPPCHGSPLLFSHSINGIMHSPVKNCHFWEGWVHWCSC